MLEKKLREYLGESKEKVEDIRVKVDKIKTISVNIMRIDEDISKQQ